MTENILTILALVLSFCLWAYGSNQDFKDAHTYRTATGEYNTTLTK